MALTLVTASGRLVAQEIDREPATEESATPSETLPPARHSMDEAPLAAAAELEGGGVVFAPYPGKSPCGEFDSPCNTYFGDTRIYRSVMLGRLWIEGEYLAWDSKATSLPPLVTTSPIGTLEDDAGVIGEPGTSILFGNENVHDTLRSGGRLNFGYWFTPQHIRGVETRLLWLDGRNIEFDAFGDEQPILARPIIDADTGDNDAVLTSFPDLQEGDISVRSDMSLFGIETLGRQMLQGGDCARLDFVGGYRYLRLYDRLRVDEVFVSLDVATGFGVDSLVARTDQFVSKNDFHGGEFGLVYRYWGCCWALQLTGKVALGGTRTVSTVQGETVEETDDDPVVTNVFEGGVLALPSNIGTYAQSQFAALGEFGVRVEYALGPQLRATLGYDYLYWSRVSRVPDSIDLTVDVSQLAPPDPNADGTRPAFAFRNTNFWSHGLTLGLYYDF